MKDSEVYLRAAERVAECKVNIFSCEEIDDISGKLNSQPRKKYQALFAPNPKYQCWSLVAELGSITKANKFRVLALCFMAAIAKSEGR